MLRCTGFSLQWLLLLLSAGSRALRLASAAVAHRLSGCKACGIFSDQGPNHVPCIGRQILIHWTTREV